MDSYFLLAAPADWLGMLIPVVVFIIWVFNQLFAKPPPRRANRPPAQAENPPRDAGTDAEIEQFLRRAAQQRGGESGQGGTQASETSRRRVASRPDQLVSAESVAEPRSAGGRSSRGARVLTAQAEQPSRVENADDLIEGHIHEVFDHQLGKLSTRGTSSREPEPPATAEESIASGIAAMLSNPNSLRHAIILQEILNRPEDRW